MAQHTLYASNLLPTPMLVEWKDLWVHFNLVYISSSKVWGPRSPGRRKKRSIINKSHQRVSHLYRTLLSSQCWNSPPSVLVTFMVPWWPQQNASWSFILISLYNCHQQLMVANDSTCILAINNVNWLSRNPQVFRTLWGYKSRGVNCEVNLPGIEDTVINQVVPPGGDSGIALCWVEACDLPKRGRLECAIFGRGGLRSRIPLHWIQTEL